LHGLIVANFSVLYQPIPSAKNQPARIPPQTPPPRGQMQRQKSAEVLPNPFPQKNSLAKPSPHFAPPTARILGGQNPERKNTLSFSKRNFTPAKPEMRGVFFLSGLPPSPRGGGGTIRRAYDFGQSHHALRAWHISRGSAGNESELFGIMTTK